MAIAPGFWGPEQTKLLESIHAKGSDSGICSLPYLQLTGDQDCANSLSLQVLPIWQNVTGACAQKDTSTLADLVGATHCQWSTPVVGSCTFDKPCSEAPLDRTTQQQLGVSLLGALTGARLQSQLEALAQEGLLTFVQPPEEDVSKLISKCPCGSGIVV